MEKENDANARLASRDSFKGSLSNFLLLPLYGVKRGIKSGISAGSKTINSTCIPSSITHQDYFPVNNSTSVYDSDPTDSISQHKIKAWAQMHQACLQSRAQEAYPYPVLEGECGDCFALQLNNSCISMSKVVQTSTSPFESLAIEAQYPIDQLLCLSIPKNKEPTTELVIHFDHCDSFANFRTEKSERAQKASDLWLTLSSSFQQAELIQALFDEYCHTAQQGASHAGGNRALPVATLEPHKIRAWKNKQHETRRWQQQALHDYYQQAVASPRQALKPYNGVEPILSKKDMLKSMSIYAAHMHNKLQQDNHGQSPGRSLLESESVESRFAGQAGTTTLLAGNEVDCACSGEGPSTFPWLFVCGR
jgi:hypothetical protein